MYASGRGRVLASVGASVGALVGALLAVTTLAGCVSEPTTHLPARGALGPYSGAVLSGDLCFVSGKIGRTGGEYEAEVNSALDAVADELGRAGLALTDVVAVTVYLTDLDRYGDFNRVYASRLSEPHPARVCVEVSRLPGNARVEIQAIAHR